MVFRLRKKKGMNIVKYRCIFLEIKRLNVLSRVFVENKILGNR